MHASMQYICAMYVCMHAIHRCTNACMQYIYAQMHACNTYMHTCMHAIHICTNACMQYIHAYMHTHRHKILAIIFREACMQPSCVYVCDLHVCTCYIHTCMHAYMHTYRHKILTIVACEARVCTHTIHRCTNACMQYIFAQMHACNT